MMKEKETVLTKFEWSVLEAVMTIPFGETRSYQWVAEKVRRPKAVRAVGQALGKNPYPVLIPCHRVIRSDGKLGGFSGGVKKKKELLNLEGQIKGYLLITGSKGAVK